MSQLSEVLTDPTRKSRVVKDCLEIIEAEVGDKGGLSGMAIKAGYKAVQGVKPGFVERVVNDLLPEFANAIDPIYREAMDAKTPVRAHFVKQKARVADALLAITDGKAARSQNRVVKGTYERLRGQAKNHVESAIPRLGGLIEKHAG